MPNFGFTIVEIEEISMHGGSLRVICQKFESKPKQVSFSPSVRSIINRETDANLDSTLWIDKFSGRLSELKQTTAASIQGEGKEIFWFGYGAPAKAVTFINEFNLNELGITGIIDDNVDKQEKYLPGSGIKIISRKNMLENIDREFMNSELRCIVFPWNLSAEIGSRLIEFSRFKLKLVWFLPTFKKVELTSENVN
jgi:hypothetical protein